MSSNFIWDNFLSQLSDNPYQAGVKEQKRARRLRDMEATMLRLDGFSYREIAEFQDGCTPQTARMRVRRGAVGVGAALIAIRRATTGERETNSNIRPSLEPEPDKAAGQGGLPWWDGVWKRGATR